MKIGAYNEEFYSEVFSGKKGNYYKMHRKKIEAVLSMLEGVKAESLLDIGCGDGIITELLSRSLSAKPFGLEISISAVKKARERKISVKEFDISEKALPYKDDFFDVIFAGDVIEHIYNTEDILKEIKRILKPNGVFVATVPNIASWYNRGFLLIGWLPTWVESASKIYTGNPFMKEGVGHIHAYTKKSLHDLLKIMGFKDIKIKGSPLLGNGEYSQAQERIWNIIDGLLSKRASFASELVLRALK